MSTPDAIDILAAQIVEDMHSDPLVYPDEPDWTIYADCQTCNWFARGEYDEDCEAVRFRVDDHVRHTGHQVQWRDAETEFYGRDPQVIGSAA